MKEKRIILWGLGVDFYKLWDYYVTEISKGSMNVVALVGKNTGELPEILHEVPMIPKESIQQYDFDYIIVSSSLYLGEILAEANRLGIPSACLIDGRIFTAGDFSFVEFCEKGDSKNCLLGNIFRAQTLQPGRRLFHGNGISISLGVYSYAMDVVLQGQRSDENPINIEIGNFSSISYDNIWEIGLNETHDYRLVSTSPHLFFGKSNFGGRLIIGSDVWIGKGCSLKISSQRPLNIGHGAVIASDSVVVKDVPPFAIVGGNPATVIKYRFSQDVIESMQRIQWWDWPVERIEANRSYFADPKNFVQMFDV